MIDGDWCSTDGMRMSISGEKITTPGGSASGQLQPTCRLRRPRGEAGSGEIVNVILRSEYLAMSRQGPADGPLQEWRRCKKASADRLPSLQAGARGHHGSVRSQVAASVFCFIRRSKRRGRVAVHLEAGPHSGWSTALILLAVKSAER
jgi:hypothetical protein